MLNIRKNCFETNSSSVHSLVICHEDWDGYRSFKYKGTADIEGGYYGRGYPIILATTIEKLTYMWTAIIELYCEFDYETGLFNTTDDFFYWKGKLQELAPNVNFVLPEEEHLIFNIGVDHVFELSNFFEACKNDENLLYDLILEDGSFIIVEGDEYTMIISAFCPSHDEETIVQLNDRYKIYIKGC